jgi:PAS domain S-box-containing protein
VTLALLLLSSSSKLTLQSPELWVYLLGLSVLLAIALRRVKAQQDPLKDEVYTTTVAIEHIQSGVAWIHADGTIRSINASFGAALGTEPKALTGRDWYELFAERERNRIQEAYSQMLLLGRATLDAQGRRRDGGRSGLEVLMVAIHDQKMRFVGHHCLVLDRTQEKLLEAQVDELTKILEQRAGAVR